MTQSVHPVTPPRFSRPALPAIPKDAADGIADLRDFCTDPTTRTTTSVSGEAISGLYRLYHLGEIDKVGQAYSALKRLRCRNGDTCGEDIPLHHLAVHKSFREVVVGLMCCMERDFDKAMKQQMAGYHR